MERRFFTVSEANQLIPFLTKKLKSLQKVGRELQEAKEVGSSAQVQAIEKAIKRFEQLRTQQQKLGQAWKKFQQARESDDDVQIEEAANRFEQLERRTGLEFELVNMQLALAEAIREGNDAEVREIKETIKALKREAKEQPED